MKPKITFISLLVVSMMTFACATKLYIPTAEMVAPNSDLTALNAGRNLMMEHCNKCHGMPKPEKHTPDQWTKILEKMAVKAKLNADQKALVLKYVTKGVK